MFLTSAILGLVKKRLYVSVITAGPEYDVLVAAFTVTDVIFQLLIAGSLNAAFIPVFSSYISEKGREASWRFVSTILNMTIIVLTLLALILFIGARQVGMIFFSGFSLEQLEMFVSVLRVLLISPLFLGVSSFIAGTLQSFRRFFMPFLSPVLYNIGAIIGIVVLYPIMGIVGVVWGVILGAFFHLIIQLPALKYIGFTYHFTLDIKDTFVKSLLTLSLPRTLGIGAEQIKTLIMLNLASMLPSGSISFLDLGQSIIVIPISLVGVSIASASFPQFAELHAKGDLEGLRKTFISSFNQILFFIMPVVVIFVTLKIPVVRLIYGSSSEQFPWEYTIQTSWVVAFLSLSIFAIALNHLMVRLYYARHNTKLPVIVGSTGVITSVISAYLLMEYTQLGVSSLALAISIGAIIECFLFIYALHREKFISISQFSKTPGKIIIVSVIMAISIYFPVQALDQIFIDTSRVVNLIILVWLVTSFGGTLYLLLSWIFGIPELKQVLHILVKLKDFQESISRQFSHPTNMPQTYIDD